MRRIALTAVGLCLLAIAPARAQSNGANTPCIVNLGVGANALIAGAHGDIPVPYIHCDWREDVRVLATIAATAEANHDFETARQYNAATRELLCTMGDIQSTSLCYGLVPAAKSAPPAAVAAASPPPAATAQVASTAPNIVAIATEAHAAPATGYNSSVCGMWRREIAGGRRLTLPELCR
jgi:hypothetical protein